MTQLPGFDPQPTLTGSSLSLRALRPSDREALFQAASDPLIWQNHPAKDRWRPEVFATYFDFLMQAGGALAVRDTDERIIGCSRYYTAPNTPDDISIGFTFLTRDHWGGPANRQMKRLMVRHALAHHDSVWFHVDPANIRSIRAMEKLGATRHPIVPLDLSGVTLDWVQFEVTANAPFLQRED